MCFFFWINDTLYVLMWYIYERCVVLFFFVYGITVLSQEVCDKGRSAAATFLPSSVKRLYVEHAFLCFVGASVQKRW